MKIIEAMKELKRLNVKADDLRKKVAQYCADLDFETPAYPDQGRQVKEWIQSHSDTVKEMLRLRVAIQRTNIATQVAIGLGGKSVTKTLAEWIHRRRDLAKMEQAMWQSLGDRGLKEGVAATTTGGTREVKIRRYFDAQERDEKTALYRDEPSVIDGTLEVVNAVTDLIES